MAAKSMNLKFRGELQNGNKSLGVINIQMISKIMRMKKHTKRMNL